MNKELFIDLQLFAEAGAGAGGDTGSATGANGVVSAPNTGSKNPLADVQYGIPQQSASQQGTPLAKETEGQQRDLDKEFTGLIKGEFKDVYNRKVEDIVKNRLKGTKETVEKYEKLSGVLDMLGKKYGVDASNIDALTQAINDDDSYYEQDALEMGLTVEQLKQMRKMEHENEELKKQVEEQERQERGKQVFAGWMQEAEEVKSFYPTFDFETEMQNPLMMELLKARVPLKTAFEVIHKDEILPAAMQYTAKQVEQKLTNKIIANGSRPAENGISSASAALTKPSVSQLTKADIEEINRRVARGERISFG